MINPKQICFACMKELPSEDAVCPSCGHDNRLRGNGAGFLNNCMLGGQYLSGKVLGRGGFGITYLGLDILLGRKVAIKEFFPEGVVHRDADTQRVLPFGGSMEEEFEKGRSRALQEARVAAQLEDVPNTVRIYSVLEANNTVYIVMEYINGITLTGYVQQSGGKLPWVQAWPIIEPVLETLGRVHERGIVHRDVSPDNIMLRYPDATPVLLDFGTARSFTTGNTEHSVSLRLGYSPMEMYTSSGAIDQRSDEYAAMATLYFMLTGNKPESPLNVAAGIGTVELPSRLGSDIPSGEGSAENVLMRGLSCRMEDRYPTIEEMRQAFRTALEQGATMAEPFSGAVSDGKKKQSGAKEKTQKHSDTNISSGQAEHQNSDKTAVNHAGRGEKQPKPQGGKKRSLILVVCTIVAVAAIAGVLFGTGILSNSKPEPTVTPAGTETEAPTEETTETTTEAPAATEAPETDSPATEAPATEVPATEAPATEVPATEVPATIDVPAKGETPETAKPAETPVPNYTITWLDDAGRTIDTTTAAYSEEPSHTDPAKEPDEQYTYTFTGWEPAITGATGDATYQAVFKPALRNYTITWQDDAGRTIYTETAAYGTEPAHTGLVKEPDEQYTYTFAGWEPAITGVTGDATYKAVFEPALRNYTITWQDDAGRTIDTTTAAYGTEPSHTDPAKEPDGQYTYSFTGWEPALSGVTGDATYKATFKPEPIETLKPGWVCPKCGRENSDEDSFCQNCGTPREAGDKWTCSKCGTENSDEDRFCQNCGTPREAGDKWTCSKCGTENSDEDRFCQNCGTPREAGNTWICTGCGKENSDEDRFCQYCGTPRAAENNKWTCSECEAENTFEDYFCINCGQTKLCLECGHCMPRDDQYCSNCATEAGKWRCRECGTLSDKDDAFCVQCGAKRHKPGADTSSSDSFFTILRNLRAYHLQRVFAGRERI